MLQNPNFPGLRTGPRWGSLQRSPDPLADGKGARYPLRSRSQGSTHYRVGNHTNDRFQMYAYMKFVFFRFRRTEKMDSVMKELRGQCPLEFLG